MIRLRFTAIFILIALLLPADSILSEEISLEEIIEKVEKRQSRIVNEIEDAVFLAEALYNEREKNDELKKELVVKKRVYMKRLGKLHEEYLGMILNGKELHGKKLKKEIKNWKKRAGKQRETMMPMTMEGEGAYDYNLIGDDTFMGKDVWIVGFKSKKKKDGYINGKGYISKDTFDIMRVEFAPAKISRVIKDIKMSLTHSDIQGYWMPVEFELGMKIKVGLFVDLFYRSISVKETYSDHKLNNQLDDSLFKSK